MSKIELLTQLEENFDISRVIANDIWIYPVIKQCFLVPAIFHVNSDHEDIRKALNKKNVLIKEFTISAFWSLKNKKLKHYDIFLLENASSRVKTKNNRYYSMRTDFIHEILNYSILNFEKPLEDSSKNHQTKTDTPVIFYADFFIRKILLESRFNKTKLRINHSDIKPIFDYLELDYQQQKIESQLRKFFQFIKHYEIILKKINPKITIIINGYQYSNMAFIYVCNKRNIPTIELQHGIIYENHPGYIYKKHHGNDLFPKYLFTFGDHFKNLIIHSSTIFNVNKIISTGFPYLEKVYNQPVDLDNDLIEKCRGYKILYFTSQWTIREELRNFVYELAEILPREYKIIYKAHPREKFTNEFYNIFYNLDNLILIQDKKISSIEIMKISDIHSTVYSTSYFESSFFGLPNIFIFNKTFSNNMEQYVDNKYSFIVNTADDYLKTLQNRLTNLDNLKSDIREYSNIFFKNDAAKLMKNQIIKVLKATKN